MKLSQFGPLLLLCCVFDVATADSATTQNQLTVVADLGGASALPYYHALNLLPSKSDSTNPPASSLPPPKVPRSANEEATFLPVRSSRMTPGELTHRIIRAPGITPFFLVGDDGRSRRWLSTHAAVLRQLGAVGFIVHVDTIPALAAVRALVPGVTVVPASADDLADRLKISHYPALVTATGIEQ